MRKILITILVVVVICVGCCAVFAFMGKPKNPPVIQEPHWDSLRTRELAQRACFDCHSNETVWPWYTNIPPFALLLRNDVAEGRSKLNFSEWNRPQGGEFGEGGEIAGEIAEVVLEGEMPPGQYLIMHPNARLSSQEIQELAQGLQSTLSK